VAGEQTAAGLPTRIPRANLFPGSAGARPGRGPATGDLPSFSQPPAGYDPQVPDQEAEPPSFPASALPRRSAEQARSRLSGFQLGSRDAQGRSPRAGEEAH